ncbi:hypothetical protein D3C76_1734300 [compost metagenome]
MAASPALDRGDAAIDLAGTPGLVQLFDIAPDRRAGTADQMLKIAHGCERSLIQQRNNPLLTLRIAQGRPPPTSDS